MAKKARVTVQGIAGPEADIVSVRVYIRGELNVVIPTTAGAAFTGIVITPQGGSALLEHSFVDSSGNESPRFQQTISIPRR